MVSRKVTKTDAKYARQTGRAAQLCPAYRWIEYCPSCPSYTRYERYRGRITLASGTSGRLVSRKCFGEHVNTSGKAKIAVNVESY